MTSTSNKRTFHMATTGSAVTSSLLAPVSDTEAKEKKTKTSAPPTAPPTAPRRPKVTPRSKVTPKPVASTRPAAVPRAVPSAPPRKDPFLLGVYAPKGGIGKTTSVCLMAHATTTVLCVDTLVIDCDAQCSATRELIASCRPPRAPVAPTSSSLSSSSSSSLSSLSAIVSASASSSSRGHRETAVPSYCDALWSASAGPVTDSPSATIEIPRDPDWHGEPLTIASALRLECNNRRVWEDHPTYRPTCLLDSSDRRAEDEDKKTQRKGSLWLVPGSPDFSDRTLEHRMAGGDGSMEQVRRTAFRRFAIGAAQRCCRRDASPSTTEATGASVVLIDLSPHSGVASTTIIMSCDAIVPCSFADQPSLDAVSLLYTDLWPRLLVWHTKILCDDAQKREDQRSANPLHGYTSPLYPFRRTTPFLCPVVVQNYSLVAADDSADSTGSRTIEPDTSARLAAFATAIAHPVMEHKAARALRIYQKRSGQVVSTKAFAATICPLVPAHSTLLSRGIGRALADPTPSTCTLVQGMVQRYASFLRDVCSLVSE